MHRFGSLTWWIKGPTLAFAALLVLANIAAACEAGEPIENEATPITIVIVTATVPQTPHPTATPPEHSHRHTNRKRGGGAASNCTAADRDSVVRVRRTAEPLGLPLLRGRRSHLLAPAGVLLILLLHWQFLERSWVRDSVPRPDVQQVGGNPRILFPSRRQLETVVRLRCADGAHPAATSAARATIADEHLRPVVPRCLHPYRGG